MSAKWFILVLLYLCIAQGHSLCITPDGKSGDCITIDTCEPLKNLIKPDALVQQENLIYLRQSHCGFDRATHKPKVCCAISGCVTRENKTVEGKCVNLFDCEHIKNALLKPAVLPEYKVYVNSLRCGSDASFSVCCGPPPSSEAVSTPSPTRAPTTSIPESRAPSVFGNRAQKPNENMAPPVPVNTDPPVVGRGVCAMSAQPPESGSGCCGIGGPTPKIYGGTATGLDQYPWLALIEYEKQGRIKLLCGGVLISGRYVLTAGHCVVGPAIKDNVPKNVRLGEYDTANEGKDCEELDGGDEGDDNSKLCTLDPVVIPIEQKIVHPDYNPLLTLKRNDIAMLRLTSIPAYTEYVRPICLPTVETAANFPYNASLYAAGWGAVSNKIPFSNIKQHVKLPYKTLEVCQQAYSVPMRTIKLWDHQVCAGGESGMDTCRGDSGGPLMYYEERDKDNKYFELIGVVSFGFSPCGLEHVPGVYTKVIKYMPWIRDNIRP